MLSSAVGEETGGAWIVGCFFAMPHGREEMNKSLIHRQGSWSGKRAMVARPKERKKGRWWKRRWRGERGDGKARKQGTMGEGRVVRGLSFSAGTIAQFRHVEVLAVLWCLLQPFSCQRYVPL